MNDKIECERLEKRREAILEAARSLFVSKGYDQTTLQDVVERAGGSLATVYKLFGNKDGLLHAVVFAKVTSDEDIIREIVRSNPDPVVALTKIAARLESIYLDREAINLVRVVIAHSIRDVEFARKFFSTTGTCTRAAITDAFSGWQAQGFKLDGSPRALGDLFVSVTIGDLQTQAISHGIEGLPSEEIRRFRLRFFLKGCGLIDRCDADRTMTPGDTGAIN
ncbi:TetR/AcrR family transcriptional regulator [Croceicoccus bisphenolivorans]|uniref:TetR/AcrR family transcriptional regulator n=1 Tax=Croceicoccus bisphenolivorans TaxID=1783232 RepID=UPI00082F3C22|nr:TetR/AcrR family transcriptional regulator [Croceicoccus bisphenolivorans]